MKYDIVKPGTCAHSNNLKGFIFSSSNDINVAYKLRASISLVYKGDGCSGINCPNCEMIVIENEG